RRHALRLLRPTGCAVTPPVPEIALPKETYKDAMTLRLRGRTAELRHPIDVHTDGDTTISFADANVLVAGDLVFYGRYPNIDFVYGGSIDGMRSEEHTSELQSPCNLVCRLLLEKKKKKM